MYGYITKSTDSCLPKSLERVERHCVMTGSGWGVLHHLIYVSLIVADSGKGWQLARI